MNEVIALLVSLSSLGIPLAAVGAILIVASLVIVFVQRRAQNESEEDDYEDDPKVQRLSTIGRVVLWLGVAVLLFGIAVIASPSWVGIF